jgi:hypothetical protein
VPASWNAKRSRLPAAVGVITARRAAFTTADTSACRSRHGSCREAHGAHRQRRKEESEIEQCPDRKSTSAQCPHLGRSCEHTTDAAVALLLLLLLQKSKGIIRVNCRQFASRRSNNEYMATIEHMCDLHAPSMRPGIFPAAQETADVTAIPSRPCHRA